MFYFDNEFLKQYLELGYKLKVVYNGGVFTVPSEEDIMNPRKGLVYDEKGNSNTIDYRQIQAIYINDEYMNLDDLQKYIDSKTKDDTDVTTKEKPKEEPTKDAADTKDTAAKPATPTPPPTKDEEPKEEPTKDKKPENAGFIDIYSIGALLLKEKRDKDEGRS